jgi:hypothetical protein
VELLRDEAGKLLLVDDKIVTQALERTLASGELVQENIAGQELLFLPSLKRAEEVIAARIKRLCASPANYPPIDVDKAVEWCQRKTGKELAPSQRRALEQALASRALVITGGPGVTAWAPSRCSPGIMVYPVIVHTAYADTRKRALGIAGGRGRGNRLAALLTRKTKQTRQQRMPGNRTRASRGRGYQIEPHSASG